jgi:hypothetical protein
MSDKTFFRFLHKCDVYAKTTSTNAAGQEYATFSKTATIGFQFQAPTTQSTSSSDRRLSPYVDNFSKYEGIVPALYSQYINFDNRITNIKTTRGVQIDTDTYEIIGIQPKFSFSGKKHHIIISLRRVVEA